MKMKITLRKQEFACRRGILSLGVALLLGFAWGNVAAAGESFVNVPVLATIPALMTRGSVLEQRRSQSVLVFASLGALVVGAVLVRIFAPMYF
jgi:large-conductance mechanosensitive channel